MSASALAYKTLKNGNKVKNIPSTLMSYNDFFESNNFLEWITWHQAGATLFIC